MHLYTSSVSILMRVRGWMEEGLLDEAREAFCVELQMSLLTRSQLERCFGEIAPIFGLKVAMRHDGEISPAALTAAVRTMIATEKERLQEVCLQTVQNLELPEADVLRDTLRKIANRHWLAEDGGEDV